MKIGRKLSLGREVSFILLTVFAVVFLFPMIWMFLTAFRTELDLNVNGTSYVPRPWSLEGFRTAWEGAPLLTWAKNSIAMTVIITVSVLFTSTLIGFVFARYRFRMKKVLFMVILATMMVPGQILMIPRFIMIQKVGLYNTLGAVIIPNLISIYNIYLCKVNIENLPESLFDAARLDGAGSFRMYRHVVIPNILPTTGTIGSFTALGAWNNYMDPLIYLNDIEKMTFPLALSRFTGQHSVTISATMAVALMNVIPMVIVFLVFQRYFIKGISIVRR